MAVAVSTTSVRCDSMDDKYLLEFHASWIEVRFGAQRESSGMLSTSLLSTIEPWASSNSVVDHLARILLELELISSKRLPRIAVDRFESSPTANHPEDITDEELQLRPQQSKQLYHTGLSSDLLNGMVRKGKIVRLPRERCSVSIASRTSSVM